MNLDYGENDANAVLTVDTAHPRSVSVFVHQGYPNEECYTLPLYEVVRLCDQLNKWLSHGKYNTLFEALCALYDSKIARPDRRWNPVPWQDIVVTTAELVSSEQKGE